MTVEGANMAGSAGKSEEEIVDWLLSTVSEILEVDPDELDTEKPFNHYGIGSTELVTIVGELETWMRLSLPSSLPFDYPNIESLARHLGGEAEERGRSAAMSRG